MTDDIELLNGIKNKDMTSMEAFYRLHENTIYRFSLKKLRNEFDASDIVNTVMLEVWNTAHRFEGRSKVTTWLIGIANHRDMQKVVEISQTRRFIDFCLEKLSGDHKQVLQLLFFNEASYDEISEALGCPVGTIKSRLHHAKTLLKKCLEKRALLS